MNDEVLFTITKDNLETGLRGYPVGYCPTSTVDPQKGLFYVGKPVDELAFWQPESIIYLLYHGKPGTNDEVAHFSENLKNRSHVSESVCKQIHHLPRKGHPMKLFCTALLLAGMLEGKNNYREDCLNLIAKIPELAALVICHHAGWEFTPSNPKLGYIENFTQMLGTPNANKQLLLPTFKLFNVLHYDHCGGNLSTFVGKAVASGLEDTYGSLSAAMAALAGPRHGKANQEALEFVEKLLKTLGPNAKAPDLEDYLRKRLENKEVIPGFGHAVLRVEDPRATVLYRMAEDKFASDPLVQIALLLRQVGSKVLSENPKISDPYPNVDAISGVLLSAAGFHYPEYYTVLFGMARVVGIGIQIVYERLEARNGKGTPIVRPLYFYKPRE